MIYYHYNMHIIINYNIIFAHRLLIIIFFFFYRTTGKGASVNCMDYDIIIVINYDGMRKKNNK